MFNPINDAQRLELRDLIQKNNLKIFEDDIINAAQNCIQLQLFPQYEFAVSSSRMGGLPDAPSGWAWPEGLEFIGQFNLAELAPYDHNHILPTQGLLSFFLDGPDAHEVVFFDEDPSKFQQLEIPEGYVTFRYSRYNSPSIFDPMQAIPCSKISLPALFDRSAQRILKGKGENNYNENDYEALLSDLRGFDDKTYCEGHQLLGYGSGWACWMAEDAWAYTTRLPLTLMKQEVGKAEMEMTGAEYQEALFEAKKAGLMSDIDNLDSATILRYLNAFWGKEKGAYLWFLHGEGAKGSTKERAWRQVDQWISLFETYSDERLGTMFNDAGTAHFMIRKDDLAVRNFQYVFSIINSG